MIRVVYLGKSPPRGGIHPMFENCYNERVFGHGLYGRHHIQRFEWMRRKVAALQKGSVSVLELGCYDGKALDYMPVGIHRYVGFDAGWEGKAIDGTPRGLEAARRRFANVETYSFRLSSEPTDIVNLPEKFDLGICLETFEHIVPSKVDSYVAAFADKLEGALLVTVPNEKGLPLLVKTVGAKFLRVNRNHSYTAWEFANALAGRMDRVPRVVFSHKGFDYTTLERSLKRAFRYVQSEGVGCVKLPARVSLAVGFVASHRPIQLG